MSNQINVCRFDDAPCSQQTDSVVDYFSKKIRKHNCCQDSFYLMCNVNKIIVDFQNYTGYCYVPYLNVWNFDDLIKSFENIDKEIKEIVCFVQKEDYSDYDLDAVYVKKNNQWKNKYEDNING